MNAVRAVVAGIVITSIGLHAAPSAGPEQSLTLFVAPDGRDTQSGRPGEPMATLEAACTAARRAKPGQQRTIIVQAGEYFLDAPVVLTGEDNGLTIKAAPGAEVRLYGGRRVTEWDKDSEKFYAAKVPGVREGRWDFRALVVNGRYCPRTRLPETGYFEHLSRFDVPWMSTTGGGWKRKPTETELTTLKYKPEDLGAWLDVNNAEVTAYHMWDESLVGVSANDTNAHTLTFSSPTGHPPGAFGVKKYVVWNTREGLTRPGQWYLDRTEGKLVYWPLPGEDMRDAEVIAPTVESIIALRGTKENPVKDVTIQGLTLSVTTTPLKAGGFGAGRFDGALSATSTENCRFADLEIVNAGGQGIKASGIDLHIANCHVHHVGACGIRYHGTRVQVTDNHIHHIGLTYPSAIALPGGGQDSLISHNHIHDTPYSTVTYGGKRTRIEGNLIHNAMQVLHDGGGIYCFAGENLILRGNFIRDITDTGGYGASAYYLDERSTNCVVEGNLSVNVARASHNHMANNNVIRNNVFINDGDLRLTFPRSSDYRFEKNILQAQGKIIFEAGDQAVTLSDNLLFSKEDVVEYRTLDRYTKTHSHRIPKDETNKQADPQLIGSRTGNIELTSESPARELGITPIDVSDAGPRKERP